MQIRTRQTKNNFFKRNNIKAEVSFHVFYRTAHVENKCKCKKCFTVTFWAKIPVHLDLQDRALKLHYGPSKEEQVHSALNNKTHTGHHSPLNRELQLQGHLTATISHVSTTAKDICFLSPFLLPSPKNTCSVTNVSRTLPPKLLFSFLYFRSWHKGGRVGKTGILMPPNFSAPFGHGPQTCFLDIYFHY